MLFNIYLKHCLSISYFLTIAKYAYIGTLDVLYMQNFS